MGGDGWWGVLVGSGDIFGVVGGGGWWWIYLAGGGWWWMVVGGGIVWPDPFHILEKNQISLLVSLNIRHE